VKACLHFVIRLTRLVAWCLLLAACGGQHAGSSASPPAGSDSTAIPPSAAGVACTDAPPYTNSGTAQIQLSVNASLSGAVWNRFYERAVAADHANTVLATAYGRNIQGALKLGHDLAGFSYARFHGILDADIGVYNEVGGTPVYNWTRFDQVYDALAAAGMRAIVEISFMPPPLSSGTHTLHFYDNVPANINAPKDWSRWQVLMSEIVKHLEARYGAEEIRNNWYFEVWNESSWMYDPGNAGYNELYANTVTGLAQADPEVKVGGPAESGPGSARMIASLLDYTRANGLKLDFLSYHRYANDAGPTAVSDALSMQTFHRQIENQIAAANYPGLVINDEWGPSYTIDGVPARDNESSASFVAKTVHLIGTDTAVAPPYMYGYWAISDLYEEVDTGTATAYREGNFGLMLKGDPNIPASWDLPKPPFNAFRLLHRMGVTQLPVTGGTTADGVNAVATLGANGNSLQVLIYNHVSGGTADSSQSTLISLTIGGIPFVPGHVRHYLIDRNHSNSYTAWVEMNRPVRPTAAQWNTLSAAGELCYYDSVPVARGSTWSASFPQRTYSVAMLEITL
jgi:xylan 1,4-beta-xylosidase